MIITVGKVTMYDLEELSKKLPLGVRGLREYIKKEKLAAKKIRNRYFVSESEVKRFLSTT